MDRTKILIVEDEIIIVDLLEMLLTKAGYDIVGIATSGEEAMAIIPNAKPDIVLMDIKLKGKMDGIDAAGLIGERFRIPVVFSTGYTDSDMLERAKDTAPYGYITKPYRESELRSVIEIALYKYRSENILHAEVEKRIVAEKQLVEVQHALDIAKHHERERKLLEDYEFIHTLLDTIPSPIFYKDRELRYQGCNRAFEEYIGMLREELAGKSVYDIAPPEIADRYQEKDRELLDRPGTQRYEWKVRNRNGEIRDVVFNKATFRDSDGGVAGMIGAITDITDFKRIEEALRRELEVSRAVSALSGLLLHKDLKLDEVARDILKYATTLTGSAHGYVAEIDPISKNLIGHTLTAMMDLCQVEDHAKRIEFPIDENGLYPRLWGYALNTGEPFYTNDISTHSASGGVPTGHIALKNFLSVPVFFNDQLIGQIALANADADYTGNDLAIVNRLASLYALAIDRIRTDVEVRQYRQHLEQLVEQRNAEIALLTACLSPDTTDDRNGA